MMVKNIHDSPAESKSIHGGRGLTKNVVLFQKKDFETALRYVAYLEIPPGGSIGYHGHSNNREEVYAILSGSGLMTVDGESKRVGKGDTILSPIGSEHGLENDSDVSLEVFVFWAVAE